MQKLAYKLKHFSFTVNFITTSSFGQLISNQTPREYRKVKIEREKKNAEDLKNEESNQKKGTELTKPTPIVQGPSLCRCVIRRWSTLGSSIRWCACHLLAARASCLYCVFGCFGRWIMYCFFFVCLYRTEKLGHRVKKRLRNQAHLGEIFVFWDGNVERNESPAAATRGTRIYGQVLRYVCGTGMRLF